MVTDPGRADAYRRAGHWDDTTLSGRLAEAASREPTRPAVVDRDGDNVHSYAELGRDVAMVAAWLEARGVGPGDVVSIQLPNWYEFVVLAVATQRVGGVINPLLPIYRRKELLHAFTVAESKVVCTPAHYRNYDHLHATRAVIEESGRSIVHVVVDEARPAPAPAPAPRPRPTARPCGSATCWPAAVVRARFSWTGPARGPNSPAPYPN